MQLVSLKEAPKEAKILILKELGYASDGEFVLDSEGKKVTDRYINVPVKIGNMVIFPGSEVILDDNEFSVSSYVEEYGEDVF